MTRHNRPTRAKKADTLLHGQQSVDDIRVDYAVGPFDAAVRQMDAKWGVDRLPDIVGQDLADKWAYSLAKMNAAISARDPEAAKQWVAVCLRGLTAMDAAAEAAGQPKADTRAWEYDLDGFKFGIMADGAAWPAIKANRPDLVLFTMREIGLAMKAYSLNSEIVTETKKHFPRAHVSKTTNKPKVDWDAGDAINF